VLLHQRLRGLDVEVARHRQHRVRRAVVGVEELRAVVDRRALQVDEVAVAVVRVGERLEQHRGQEDPGEPAVRAVQHVEPDLLLHHVDLVAEVLVGELRRAHAVRFEEQRPLQRRARQHLVVVGVVGVRGPVERAARRLHVPEVGQLLQALAALEHQVLEEVREPGAPLRLGTEADVVVHADANDRCAGVGGEHHPQAVGQREPVQFG
jgi:hypothetical protein